MISQNAVRRDAEWRGMELNLAVDNWEMGWGAIYLGWTGWGADLSHGICMNLPLFCCPV